MKQKIKTEMISRRKALSLLGFGAALGFTLSSALEPLEAEAQEAAGRRRARCRPPEPMGCNGGKGGAAVAMSDAMAAKSTATSDERVRNQQRRRLPEQLHRSSGPSALNRLIARFDERREIAMRPAGQAMSETADERNRRKRKARSYSGRTI